MDNKYAIRLYTFNNSKRAKPVEEGADLLSPYVINAAQDPSIGTRAAHHINEEAFNDTPYDRNDTSEEGSWDSYRNKYYIVNKTGKVTPTKSTVNKGFSGYSLSDPFQSIYSLNDILFNRGAGLSEDDFNERLEKSSLLQAVPSQLLDAIKRSTSVNTVDGSRYYNTDRMFIDSPVTDYFGKHKTLDDGKAYINKNNVIVDVSDVKLSDFDKARAIDDFMTNLSVFNTALFNQKKKSYNDLFLVEVPINSIIKSKDVISSLGTKGALQRDDAQEFTTTRLIPKRRLFAQEAADRIQSDDTNGKEWYDLRSEQNPTKKIQLFNDYMKKYYDIDTDYLLSDAQQKYVLDDISNYYNNRSRHNNIVNAIKEVGQ